MATSDSSRTTLPAGARAGQQFVFVDVSERPKTAGIVREGHEVPVVNIDPARGGFIIENLPVIPPRQAPRVVTQSIAPGTLVTRGTAIDIVLAPTTAIPFEIFRDPHADLVGRPLQGIIDGVLDDPRARQIVLTAQASSDISATDRSFLLERLNAVDVGVNDEDPNRSFDRAFNNLRGAAAFR